MKLSPPVNGVKKKEDVIESQESSLENGSSEKVTSQEASPETVEERPEKETSSAMGKEEEQPEEVTKIASQVSISSTFYEQLLRS